MESVALTTHQAFAHLCTQRGLAKVLGLPQNTWNSLRTRFKNGQLSQEKQEEILSSAGFAVVQERTWALKR